MQWSIHSTPVGMEHPLLGAVVSAGGQSIFKDTALPHSYPIQVLPLGLCQCNLLG